jgi:hypothetical protein
MISPGQIRMAQRRLAALIGAFVGESPQKACNLSLALWRGHDFLMKSDSLKAFRFSNYPA